MSVRLEGSPTKYASAVAYRIDEGHANPRAAWVAMGSPPHPTADQTAALLEASTVAATKVTPQPDGSFSVVMPPNSAVLLSFR